MMIRASRSIAVVLALALAVSCSRSGGAPSDESARIHALVEGRTTPAYVDEGREGQRAWMRTRQVYAQRQFAPAWTDDRRPTRAMDQGIAMLADAGREGLDPAAYDAPALQEARREVQGGGLTGKRFEAPRAAEVDVWLTHACLEYGTDLASGTVNPRAVDPHWHMTPRTADVAAMLARAVESGDIRRTMATLAPRHQDYAALREALAKYRAIAARGGWPPRPAKILPRPGARHPAVTALRQRLAAEGDLADEPAADPSSYDGSVEPAVRSFQNHHGLRPTGVVDADTVAAMNVSVDARVRQIELNMDRWRWAPDSLGDPHIRINIPQYALDVRDGTGVPLTMRVVVGKSESPTPIFSDPMTHVVFSPYWNMPASIVRNEAIPTLLQDPGYLARNNIELVRANGSSAAAIDPLSVDWSSPEELARLTWRQRPGPRNALGLVKFMFPNEFNVYLHDTPADTLFSRVERRFSHGCVRLERPMELARYVLRDQPQWTGERIAEAMHSGAERHVQLTRPIPVHLQYWTAWVDQNGGVNFRDDIYGYDQRQAAQRPRAPRSSEARATTGRS